MESLYKINKQYKITRSAYKNMLRGTSRVYGTCQGFYLWVLTPCNLTYKFILFCNLYTNGMILHSKKVHFLSPNRADFGPKNSQLF